MSYKLARHNVGGIALVNGLLLYTEDAAVLSIRTDDKQIVTEYWKIPREKKVHSFWHFFGIRGLYLLWRAVWWNSRARSFIDTAEKNIKQSKQKDKKKNDRIIVRNAFFPFAGLLVAFMVYVDLISAWSLYSDIVYGQAVSGRLRSDLLILIITIAVTIYLIYISRYTDYMGYHGAEHQAISAIESGKSITFAHVIDHWPYQTRCGAAAVSYTAIILILFGWYWPNLSFWPLFGLTLVLFSLSYELVLVLDRYSSDYWAEFLSLPGVLLQLLIAKQPDRDQSEVAAKAAEELVKESHFLHSNRSLVDDEPLLI